MSERINITLEREQWDILVRSLSLIHRDETAPMDPWSDVNIDDVQTVSTKVQDILGIEPLPVELVERLYRDVETDDCQPDGAPYASLNEDGSVCGWWVPCAVFVANNDESTAPTAMPLQSPEEIAYIERVIETKRRHDNVFQDLVLDWSRNGRAVEVRHPEVHAGAVYISIDMDPDHVRRLVDAALAGFHLLTYEKLGNTTVSEAFAVIFPKMIDNLKKYDGTAFMSSIAVASIDAQSRQIVEEWLHSRRV